MMATILLRGVVTIPVRFRGRQRDFANGVGTLVRAKWQLMKMEMDVGSECSMILQLVCRIRGRRAKKRYHT